MLFTRQELLPKANATCKLCGNPYYICKQCMKYRDRGIYGWKLVADTPQCYQMYSMLNLYNDGKASAEEVKETVAAIEQYSPIPEFISPYNEIYNKVVTPDKEEKKEEISKIETTEQTHVVEEKREYNAQKPNYSKSYNKKQKYGKK